MIHIKKINEIINADLYGKNDFYIKGPCSIANGKEGFLTYIKNKKYLKYINETSASAIIVDKRGYSKFFLLDGKSMNVENFSMEDTKIKKGTVGEFKRIFGKSMKNRLVSRVVLNKFIQEVA